MPFDPSQFVFQPRPLQQYDFGQGFRDLIQARQGKRNSDLLEQQNKDVNTRYAADFARDRGKLEHESATSRYKKREEVAEAMRKAGQAMDLSTVRALAPTLQELGGTYREEPGADPNRPNFYIETGQAPGLGQYDVQGAHRQIFGGGGPGSALPAAGQPAVGQPFQMRSNVGPGAAFAERGGPAKNPFEALPGASAAAAGPLSSSAQPSPSPRPSAGSPQLTGPNPMNPPAFSPYRINTADVATQNQGQLRPLLEGIERAAPPSPVDIGALNAGALETGMSPERLLEAYKPGLDAAIKIYSSQQNALAAQGRLDQSRLNADTAREDKLRKEAQTKSYRIIQNDDLKKTKTKLAAAKDALSYVDMAVRNPQAANALVTKMYHMNEDGLITNQDFTRTLRGAETIVEAWKNRTLETLLLQPTGVSPLIANKIKEIIDVATRNQQRQMKSAADKMYQMYKSAPTEGERREYEDGFRLFFDPEYYPPEIAEPWEMGVPGEEPAEENLGTAPLPRTLDSGGNRPTPVGPGVQGSRVPPRPRPPAPRPQPAAAAPKPKLTAEEAKKKSTAELFQMLQELKKSRGDK